MNNDEFDPTILSEEERAVVEELNGFDAEKVAKIVNLGVETVKAVEGAALGTCIYSMTKQFIPEGAKWYTKAAFAVTAYSLGALAVEANDARINNSVNKVATAMLKLTAGKEN